MKSDGLKHVNTGILKTALPRHEGHLLRDSVIRLKEPLFLKRTSYFNNLAAAFIRKHGFPLTPKPADLLKAPAPVYEAYELRAAWEELYTRLTPLVFSRAVADAVLDAQQQQHGDLPRHIPGELVGHPPDESTAQLAKNHTLLRLVSAAVEVGMLGERLEVRQHEPAAKYGKSHLKKLSKNRGVQQAAKLKKAKIYWCEMKRLKEANPARSWKNISLELQETLRQDPDFGNIHWATILDNTRAQRKKYQPHENKS